jgi:excisionase family DNA binding protein
MSEAIWLTVEEVAAALRVPRSTVYEHVRRGAIPARRIGRHLRIHRSWLDATTQESNETMPKPTAPQLIGRKAR